MIKTCGLKDYLVYIKDSHTGIYQKGQETVENFVRAVNNRNEDALAALFYGVEKCIQFPVGGKYYSPREFLGAIEKDDRLSVDEITPSSWTTTCIFEFKNEKSPKKGIAFFGFNPRCKKIESIRFYWED